MAVDVAKLLECLCDTLEEHKAENITCIDLDGKSDVADYMIVASGRSGRHVMHLADYVEEALARAGYPPISVEGKQQGDWVLVDGVAVVTHLFRPEVRDFYAIEKIWDVPAMEVAPRRAEASKETELEPAAVL